MVSSVPPAPSSTLPGLGALSQWIQAGRGAGSTVPCLAAALCLGWDPWLPVQGALAWGNSPSLSWRCPSCLLSLPDAASLRPPPGRLGPPGSGRTWTGPGTAPVGLGRAVQPWGMGKGTGEADVGRGIYPVLSLCSVSFHIHLPCSLTPPHVMPLPKSTEQSIAHMSHGCLEHFCSHKPCLVLSEMCPLLAREGGHLRPLQHLCAGGERVRGVRGPGSLHPGGFKLHHGVRGGTQQGLAVPLTPPGSLVGWQRCVTEQSRGFMAQRAGSHEPPARGGVCRAPACPRRLRGSRTQPWRGEERGQLGRAALLALCCLHCAIGLCPMGVL